LNALAATSTAATVPRLPTHVPAVSTPALFASQSVGMHAVVNVPAYQPTIAPTISATVARPN
jgi:hypothetical protein